MPAYNEEAALDQILAEIIPLLPGLRIWIVDDGSSDNTSGVVLKWSEKNPVTLLTHPTNRGMGTAMITGFTEILPHLENDDLLVTLDADMSHPPEIIPEMMRVLEEEKADIVIASRFTRGGRAIGVPFHRRLFSHGARLLLNLFFPIPNVRDYTCAFRLYRGKLLHEGNIRWKDLITETGFASTLECLLKLAALSPHIVEVPLVLRYDRKPTKSKMPVPNTIWRTLALLYRLKGQTAP